MAICCYWRQRSLKLFDSLKSKPDILKKDIQQDVKKDIKDKKEVLRDKIKAIKQQIKSENEKEKKEEGTVRWVKALFKTKYE